MCLLPCRQLRNAFTLPFEIFDSLLPCRQLRKTTALNHGRASSLLPCRQLRKKQKSPDGPQPHTYRFDSLENRKEKDGEAHEHNALNQLIKKGNEQFTYDDRGNLISREKDGKAILYHYDGLDRLISIQTTQGVVCYTYDPFNRRMAKKCPEEEDQLFIYQGQEEIGLWKQEAIQELRITGSNERTPMVAMEIKGELYAPMHDLTGNVACLTDRDGEVVERYRYTAYGESEILSPSGQLRASSAIGNPWQYASKRLDPETGFVAFGLRYYDPKLGRWITPDPAGFEDGQNLYAYVHNSPLLHFDQ